MGVRQDEELEAVARRVQCPTCQARTGETCTPTWPAVSEKVKHSDRDDGPDRKWSHWRRMQLAVGGGDHWWQKVGAAL